MSETTTPAPKKETSSSRQPEEKPSLAAPIREQEHKPKSSQGLGASGIPDTKPKETP